jgi:hypothetical protein
VIEQDVWLGSSIILGCSNSPVSPHLHHLRDRGGKTGFSEVVTTAANVAAGSVVDGAQSAGPGSSPWAAERAPGDLGQNRALRSYPEAPAWAVGMFNPQTAGDMRSPSTPSA